MLFFDYCLKYVKYINLIKIRSPYSPLFPHPPRLCICCCKATEEKGEQVKRYNFNKINEVCLCTNVFEIWQVAVISLSQFGIMIYFAIVCLGRLERRANSESYTCITCSKIAHIP